MLSNAAATTSSTDPEKETKTMVKKRNSNKLFCSCKKTVDGLSVPDLITQQHREIRKREKESNQVRQTERASGEKWPMVVRLHSKLCITYNDLWRTEADILDHDLSRVERDEREKKIET